MHYVANKKMILAGQEYAKGDPLAEGVFEKIAPNRQGALLRTRLIIEVEGVIQTPMPAKGDEGDMCPKCDGGPFKRLEQHISMKHDVSEDE